MIHSCLFPNVHEVFLHSQLHFVKTCKLAQGLMVLYCTSLQKVANQHGGFAPRGNTQTEERCGPCPQVLYKYLTWSDNVIRADNVIWTYENPALLGQGWKWTFCGKQGGRGANQSSQVMMLSTATATAWSRTHLAQLGTPKM